MMFLISSQRSFMIIKVIEYSDRNNDVDIYSYGVREEKYVKHY